MTPWAFAKGQSKTSLSINPGISHLTTLTVMNETEMRHSQNKDKWRPGMKWFTMCSSRCVVGTFLAVIAITMFLFLQNAYSAAGAVAIGVLGLVTIAISKRCGIVHPVPYHNPVTK
jgi:hypothetical protein